MRRVFFLVNEGKGNQHIRLSISFQNDFLYLPVASLLSKVFELLYRLTQNLEFT
jgi:hypothetical protein